MTKIHLITKINAPINQVFDLARNIDVHQQSTASSYEKAIDGITSGLINLNETVTWRGKHFGIYLKHKSLISEMEFPTYFVDEMLEGHFKSFRHEHNFVEKNEKTVMIDTIEYQTPFGMLGRIFDQLVLKNHLTQFITERNKFIKKLAESH
ncbi:MAG: SRPBCC family protein [Bacteroidetes bacterium]|uniref:SRPBCC family protein n=1 Tax=Flavobacterium sp. TaxID=239 RepID=UPI002FD90923|nr:SRPBCC family protein [Bacteroidota bacterium]